MDTSQYLGIFIIESTEHLDTLYEQMLELEKNPEEKAIIEEIFRADHTLKGMSATMGYEDIAHLTHKLENIFDAIRNDKLTVKVEIMDFLFTTVDQLNDMVSDVANGGTGEADVSHIIAQLDKLEKGEPIGDVSNFATQVDGAADVANVESLQNLDEFQRTILQESIEKGYQNYEISVTLG